MTRILIAAILAGVLSGVFVTAVQALRVTPLIIEAEHYEKSEQASEHAHDADASGGAVAPHPHEAETWGPEDGLERTIYTLLTNVLVGVAFSLILVAGILATNSPITLTSGLVWGLGGFIAFVMAPNFGLSPELPGMQAAELQQRQIWWFATVAATAIALMIFAFKQKIVWMAGGLLLLLLPHIIGAPMPDDHTSLVPADLAARFVVATLVTSFLFWLVLGGTLGFLVERFGKNTSLKSPAGT